MLRCAGDDEVLHLGAPKCRHLHAAERRPYLCLLPIKLDAPRAQTACGTQAVEEAGDLNTKRRRTFFDQLAHRAAQLQMQFELLSGLSRRDGTRRESAHANLVRQATLADAHGLSPWATSH